MWFRITAVSFMAMALMACGGDPVGGPVQGKWGWFNPSACEDDRDVIGFDRDHFTQWVAPASVGFDAASGEVVREGHDTTYSISDEGWITATYILDVPDGEPQTVAMTLEPSSLGGREVLLFRGVLIDGTAPAAAADAAGRPLFRCGEDGSTS